MKFALYCGTAFSQLLSWCLIGNMLLHQVKFSISIILIMIQSCLLQSLTLTDSQWQSGWEDEHYLDFAYLMIFSMVRGGRSLELKAIQFYSMSMDTFIVVCMKILRGCGTTWFLIYIGDDTDSACFILVFYAFGDRCVIIRSILCRRNK